MPNITKNSFMLSVVMLSVIMLSVLASLKAYLKYILSPKQTNDWTLLHYSKLGCLILPPKQPAFFCQNCKKNYERWRKKSYHKKHSFVRSSSFNPFLHTSVCSKVCLSVQLAVRLSACRSDLYVCQLGCLVCLSVSQSVCLLVWSVCLSVPLSVFKSVCLSVCLLVGLVCMSVSLYVWSVCLVHLVCLSVCLRVCLFVCLLVGLVWFGLVHLVYL